MPGPIRFASRPFDFCYIPTFGNLYSGRMPRAAAVRKMAEATAKLLERSGVTGADLGCFIPHQANKRIITATADRLGMDPERVIINIEKYGNTSAGTIPLAMETAVEEGKLKKGDLVLIAAVGAGFTVGAALLRWEI